MMFKTDSKYTLKRLQFKKLMLLVLKKQYVGMFSGENPEKTESVINLNFIFNYFELSKQELTHNSILCFIA